MVLFVLILSRKIAAALNKWPLVSSSVARTCPRVVGSAPSQAYAFPINTFQNDICGAFYLYS